MVVTTVGNARLFTSQGIIRILTSSGGIKIPDTEAFKRTLQCYCEKCANPRSTSHHMNGDHFYIARAGNQLAFYRKGCPIKPEHQDQLIDRKVLNSELVEPIRDTIDGSLFQHVQPSTNDRSKQKRAVIRSHRGSRRRAPGIRPRVPVAIK